MGAADKKNKTERHEQSLMKIEKLYFALDEVRERWGLSDRDLAYLAENGDLRVSVRVSRLPVEIGSMEETAEGERFRVPHTQIRFSGVLELHADDAFRVFRKGSALLSQFLATDGDYVSVLPDCEAVDVLREDLLVRTQERDRFEHASGFAIRPAEPSIGAFASADYRKVWLHGELLQFGRIQADVIRALHAAQRGGDPWQSGKSILTDAGSKSLRMADVFKANPGWRRLIQSNQRGFFRLAVDLTIR